MKVLITGVAGLLGSRMADWIIENRPAAEVYGIDDLSGGYDSNVAEDVHFIEKNLVDEYDEVDELFEAQQFDIVYHFAAYAAEGLSPFIRNFNYSNNLIATTNIVNSCIKHNVGRLVFTSTMAVYGHGDKEGNLFSEDLTPAPIDPYGVAKYACEMDIQIAGEQHGLDWCILRPHNVYGAKQNIWDKYRNVLGIWMYQALEGKPFTIYGDGSQLRAFSCIDDCLEPMWLAGTLDKASKEIINIGGKVGYTILRAADVVASITETTQKHIFLEGRHEVHTAHPTWSKSVDILGYEDNKPLYNGLAEMWRWAKEQPKREQFIWDQYELDKGIYSYWSA